MKISTLFLSVITLILSGLFFTQPASANEGIITMEASDGTGGRCYIFSNLLSDFHFVMLANCRDLKYPIADNLFHYVIWADHGDNEPTRLGSLGVGKAQYETAKAFSRIFVTKEAVRDPEAPSGNMFMNGVPRAISYLQGRADDTAVATPQPTETPQVTATPKSGFGQAVTGSNTNPQQNSGFTGAIRVLAIIVIVVVVLVVAIAFISASRRRPVNI